MQEAAVATVSYNRRIEALRERKLAQTREKQKVIGSMDHDDWALILPPVDRREMIETISGSGMPITDCLLKGYTPESNHSGGGFFGAKISRIRHSKDYTLANRTVCCTVKSRKRSE